MQRKVALGHQEKAKLISICHADDSKTEAALLLLNNTAQEQILRSYLASAKTKLKQMADIFSSNDDLASIYPLIRGLIEDIQREEEKITAANYLSSAIKASIQSVKNVITQATQSLKREMNNLLQDPELAYKSFALACEQNRIFFGANYASSVTKSLSQVQEEYNRISSCSAFPTIFISYSYPASEFIQKEFWVQNFLKQLGKHLYQAGMQVILDIGDPSLKGNPIGGNIYQFMDKAETSDYVILIGTESLKHKHMHGHGLRAVNTELNLALAKREDDIKLYGESRVLPLMVSGTIETSFPESYLKYTNIVDMRDFTYLRGLIKILNRLLPIAENHTLWDTLFQAHPELDQPLERQVVETFIQANQVRSSSQQTPGPIQKSAASSGGGLRCTSIESNASYQVNALHKRIEEVRKKALQNEDIKLELANYIPARCAHPRAMHNACDLHEFVNNFVSSNKTVLMLTGDAGSGKSTFNQFLERALWQEYKDDAFLPLFISLPLLSDPCHNVLNQALTSHGFSPQEILILEERFSFVLIFDAYEEANLKKNLYITNQLGQYGKRVKVVIACRTDYRDKIVDYKHLFVPFLGEKRREDLFEERAIIPFNTQQIEAYVIKYTQLNASELSTNYSDPSWCNPDDYLKRLKDIAGLYGLISNPFLLYIAMKVLPDIVELYEHLVDKERFTLTRAKLYDLFAIHLFSRSRDRMIAFDQEGYHEGIMEDFYQFSVELAHAMTEKNLTHVTYFPQRQRLSLAAPSLTNEPHPFAKFFSDEDPLWVAARKGCPLRTLGAGIYTFLHPSLITFFESRYQYDASVNRTPELALDQMRSLQVQVSLNEVNSVSVAAQSATKESATSVTDVSFFARSGGSDTLVTDEEQHPDSGFSDAEIQAAIALSLQQR